MYKEITVFNFWKGNKISGHFQLTDKEMIEKFNDWLTTKNRAWLEYYSTEPCVQAFISEGLNAVGNSEAEYQSMSYLLKPERRKYLDKLRSNEIK